jgi:hypothetical protein
VDIAGLLPEGYEPSGAVWHPHLAKLFVVSDSGLVSMLNDDGTAMTTWPVSADLEAVTVADPTGDLIYLGVEDPDSIYEFDIVLGVVTRSFDLTATLAGPSSRGLEALTFIPDPMHPEGGLFYAGLQNDGRIYVFDLPISTSTTSTNAVHINTIEPVAGRDDLSGLDWVESTSTLYAIYDGDDLLRAMLADGTFVDEWALPGDGQEGVAFGDCTLFVAHDTTKEILRYTFPVIPADEDTDGIDDCLDNCPAAANAGQMDMDVDGAGDLCDCAPADATASRVPIEVGALTLTDSTLCWEGNETYYDVAWGIAADLRAAGNTDSAACLIDDVIGNTTPDNVVQPNMGIVHYFMVRGQNVCGSGTYGSSDLGAPRQPLSGCP